MKFTGKIVFELTGGARQAALSKLVSHMHTNKGKDFRCAYVLFIFTKKTARLNLCNWETK